MKHGALLRVELQFRRMTTIETVELDRWVESLAQCKQLTEADVKTLCEKVTLAFIAPELMVLRRYARLTGSFFSMNTF